ncbi:Rrf2 family transcriptional regulator [Allofranklinella schreckenbergeri]|uniref:Rrf2 family transcriptional regulator n=1 Tax=Allofranklinella schreckenbergeri TaxID=1076744 RepID=A0A3M6R877_9BURK|nr:Rrf2 family transcriptional regulator [Allofranklinella schreckenbergeri]RMW96764.1 Rrf2 family transcriptional regulator [Allofranklinella schreckenbergeri]RMW99765.1 Rrf2 family transcriptional regulator [Allofranklinella schreckenbergeri]RMX11561.1 Rrf2 family transcriptional regulator [Allofranklinella schreckenbergeri]RRD42330.1 Rrf2 family transcriptional regulator [Comamonadaceae bacterium OH3737_COT-264]
MKLTLKTDYALRTLLYLAQTPAPQLCSIAEVAKRHGISENHLVKVVHALGKHGYIETLRGKGGGIRIAPRTWEVSVGEIVRAMEEDFALVECFKPAPADGAELAGPLCVLAGQCRLQGVLGRALQAFLAELDACPFKSLVPPRGPVQSR